MKSSLADILPRGCYPEVASRPRVDRQLWRGSYLATYLERDVRNLANVGDLGQFERFLRLCAIRTRGNVKVAARGPGAVDRSKPQMTQISEGITQIGSSLIAERSSKRIPPTSRSHRRNLREESVKSAVNTGL